MSSSGTTACYFIVKHVGHPKLITIVLSFSSLKSKEIRRVIQDFVGHIIAIWTLCKLEKSLSGIVDCIKTLDPSKQRSLSGAVSAASSSQSTNSERDSLNMAQRMGALGV
ncbi:hypothetical protein DICVIV_13669, partial [Dictyocaulus viviparus]